VCVCVCECVLVSVNVCGCVVYCQSKFTCLLSFVSGYYDTMLLSLVQVPRLTSTSLASEFKRAAMVRQVRQTKFDNHLNQILASDWVQRRHLFGWVRRLS
jgi:hypothetical protein